MSLNKQSLHLLQTGYTTVTACFLNSHSQYVPAWAHAKTIRTDKTTASDLLATMQKQLKHLAQGQKPYTYKMPNGLCKTGDMAVVETNTGLKTVYIIEVHDEPDIDPNADYDYRWIVSPVRHDIYFDVLIREQRLSLALRDVEKQRQSSLVRESVLSGLPEDKRNAFEQAIAETANMSTLEHKLESK